MRSLIIVISLFASANALCAGPRKMLVAGYAKELLADKIQIQTSDGAVYVPRSSLTTKKNPREGEKIVAQVSFAELVQANR